MAKIRGDKKFCSCGTRILTKSNYCSPCAVIANQKSQGNRLAAGWSKFDVYNYKRRENNPKSYLLQNAKSRAKKKGLEFDLTVDDFEIPTHCPVFGFELELLSGQGTKDNKPSLDRIKSSKGYVKGNVQVLSWRANNLKSDGILTEFEKLVEFLRNAEEDDAS